MFSFLLNHINVSHYLEYRDKCAAGSAVTGTDQVSNKHHLHNTIYIIYL